MKDNFLKRLVYRCRYSLGAKINFIFAIILIVFIISFVYSTYTLRGITQAYHDATTSYYDIVRLKETIIQCDRFINEYLRSGNRTSLTDFNDTSRNFRAVLRKVRERPSTSLETLYLMRSLSDSFETYHAVCCTACFKFYEQDYDYYNSMYEAKHINTYLQKYSDELLQLTIEEGEKTYTALTKKQKALTAINGGSIIFILALFAFSILYVNANVTQPLGSLVMAAQKIAAGDFNVYLPIKNKKDTIGVLQGAFNFMSQNIKNMMESIKEKAETEKSLLLEQQKNVEYQKMLSEANFLALQTQTNPHFMFNTLNSISRTITLGMSDEAVMMIDSMATLLRYNLTDAAQPVLLKEELTIVSEYLRIQQYRFADRIAAKIDCSEMLADIVMLPRFTLQPIVENAIIHGLEPKEEGGSIKIKVRRKGDMCIICIIDNGIGISDEKLHEISSDTYGHTNSIGVANTRKRIEIFSRCRDAFHMISKVNYGTITIIKLPLKGGESNV